MWWAISLVFFKFLMLSERILPILLNIIFQVYNYSMLNVICYKS